MPEIKKMFSKFKETLRSPKTPVVDKSRQRPTQEEPQPDSSSESFTKEEKKLLAHVQMRHLAGIFDTQTPIQTLDGAMYWYTKTHEITGLAADELKEELDKGLITKPELNQDESKSADINSGELARTLNTAVKVFDSWYLGDGAKADESNSERLEQVMLERRQEQE